MYVWYQTMFAPKISIDIDAKSMFANSASILFT